MFFAYQLSVDRFGERVILKRQQHQTGVFMSKHLKGFMDFVREQGVVGLAIGLAVGTQAAILVKDMIKAIVDPIIGLIIGNPEGLQAAVWNVNVAGRKATFGFGQLAYSIIVFIAVCAVIYFVVHGLKLDKADKKKK